MNKDIQHMSTFFEGVAYNKLCEEAIHNDNAIELLEILDLTLASVIFFYNIKETYRYETELNNVNKIVNIINKLYEE